MNSLDINSYMEQNNCCDNDVALSAVKNYVFVDGYGVVHKNKRMNNLCNIICCKKPTWSVRHTSMFLVNQRLVKSRISYLKYLQYITD